MIDNVRTGQNIAAFRQRLGWTQGELASRLNVTHQAVSKWENGVAFPDISTLYVLSQLFGVSMEVLLTGEPATPVSTPEAPVQPAPPDQITPPRNEMPAPEETSSSSAADPAPYDWEEIIALAPFASRNTLDRLVSQCEAACSRKRIMELAPFIGQDTIDRLLRKSNSRADWDFILELAPFASRDTLDYLVSQCESPCSRKRIMELAPFLGRDTLDRLIQKNNDHADWDFIIALAPFASRDTLDDLVSQCESPCSRKRIMELAPFLGRDMLDRILFGASQSKTTAQSAAWAEAHEKEADELAAWAEAHEKVFEQQARRAEQIAERMEERMLKRSERLAERFARQAEQTADALQTFSPLPEKPLDREAANQPTAYSQRPADDRRTEIIDAAPSASTLEEYSAQILSRLYKVLDPSDSVVGRIEEIRCALLNQNFAALNEFAPILDAHIGPEWLEEYAFLCPDAEIPPDFEQQIDLALTQCNWNWIEDHAHLISDPDMIRRIVLASTTEGFFDFVPLFADQLDQQSINDAARLAVRMNCTDDILPVAGRVSPGILD